MSRLESERNFKRRPPHKGPKARTAWHKIGDWYDSLVGEKGHYYHQAVIIPGVLRLLQITKGDSLLDVGCGQGVLGRQIPKGVDYWGIDASRSLIDSAKQSIKGHFICADATRPLPIPKTDFDLAAAILCLQNMENAAAAISNAAKHLKKNGTLVFVLNHPCFRIPRQSAWGIDEGANLQYRRMNRYLGPIKIPMSVHPGKGDASPVMWAFHQPLSYYFKACRAAGLTVTDCEEWVSDKTSVGSEAKRENRARSEFPLFLAIRARKI